MQEKIVHEGRETKEMCLGWTYRKHGCPLRVGRRQPKREKRVK